MMATKLTVRTTTLITILRFIGFITLFTTTSAESPNYVDGDCQNSTEQALTTAYQTKLNNILSWASSDSARGKRCNYTSIGTGTVDAIYGFYDCRGDISQALCQFCVSTAAAQIPQFCPNGSSAIVWYHCCILRYSNHDFLRNPIINPFWKVLGSKNIAIPEELEKTENCVQNLISKATVETNQLFAMGKFSLSPSEERYAMVQCGRDLSSDQCSQCLKALLDKVPQCCGAKLGWQILFPSCMMKYDDNMFFQITNQTSSSSPLPNPGKFTRWNRNCCEKTLTSIWARFRGV